MDAPSPVLNFALIIILIAVIVVFALFLAFRVSKSSTALMAQQQVEKWEQEARAVRKRADRLHDDLDSQLAVNRELTEKIGRLESLPDLSRLLELMEGFDQRATERHTQLLGAIEQLVERLGR